MHTWCVEFVFCVSPTSLFTENAPSNTTMADTAPSSSNETFADVFDQTITLLYQTVAVDEKEFEEAWHDVVNQMEQCQAAATCNKDEDESQEECKRTEPPSQADVEFREYLVAGVERQAAQQQSKPCSSTTVEPPPVACMDFQSLFCYSEVF